MKARKTMDKATFHALADAYLGGGEESVQWARHTGRALLRCRIWQKRDPDSTPYYPTNEILRRCIAALEEIILASGPRDCLGPERELLEALCGRQGDPVELALALEGDPLGGEYAYYATHHLVSIDRIAGGHRSPLANDTELDLSIYLMDGTDPAAAEAAVGDICRRHGVELLVLGQSQGGFDHV